MKKILIQIGHKFFSLKKEFEIGTATELANILSKYDVRLLQEVKQNENKRIARLLQEVKQNENMKTKEFIDIIQPEHSRTSCNDKDLANGLYSGDYHTRCLRCTLLEVLQKGYLPPSHELLADFSINPKLSQKEQKEVRQE